MKRDVLSGMYAYFFNILLTWDWFAYRMPPEECQILNHDYTHYVWERQLAERSLLPFPATQNIFVLFSSPDKQTVQL